MSAAAPLRLSAERGPQGDRCQATLTLDPAGIVPGPISGTILVDTNDPQFGRLSVPFSGTIRP